MTETVDWELVEATVKQLVEYQKKRLLAHGRRVIPTLTPEDMLQPNDYPELEENPDFRYEEGVFSGILSVQTALRAANQEVLGTRVADES